MSDLILNVALVALIVALLTLALNWWDDYIGGGGYRAR